MNPARLLVTVLATAYFVIGSRLEETKLARYHGEVYKGYREHVPALILLPWRHLDPQEAETLSAHDHAARD
jgi:protein-S-isoprenylcysteine O-methyltransferase Ste14